MLERSSAYRAAGETARHSLLTRWSHVALASTIIIQLLTSLVMNGPHRGRPGDVLFTVHEIFGILALVLAFAFWCVVALRRRGTPVAMLFPWFSPRRVRDVWRDGMDHIGQVLRLRLPAFEEESPLASAVHGLGLLLMSVMAVTGTVWFVNDLWIHASNTFTRVDIVSHHLFANLVWAYLIGHAGLAVVHHLAGQASLGTMWSVKPAVEHLKKSNYYE